MAAPSINHMLSFNFSQLRILDSLLAFDFES